MSEQINEPLRAYHSTPPPPPMNSNGQSGFATADDSNRPLPNTLLPPKTTPTRQFAALFLVPVTPSADALSHLRALLEKISTETSAAMQGVPDPQPILPFHRIGSVHYARLVLLESRAGVGPMLALATDYDGPEGDETVGEAHAFELHIEQLLILAPGLDQIFQHCARYPGRDQLRKYLVQHRLRSRTSFVGAPGRSRDQIVWEAALRRRVDQLVATSASDQTDAETLRKLVRRQLEDEGWSLPTFSPQANLEPRLVRALGARVGLVLALLGACAWQLHEQFAVSVWITLACLAATIAGAVVRFRRLEKTDLQFQPKLSKQTHDRLRVASAHENDFVQNQLTHLVAIKRGPFRWFLIRVVFHVLQLFATYRYNHGSLGGIPSIHFARWVLIPGRGVLFFSNFDNSWQSYLGDFIDKASAGLTAVWSNTVGYPRSRWLLWAGAEDASRFLAWTREHQQPTQVWYCAYPELSIVNINDNTEIRRGLAADDTTRRGGKPNPNQVEARTWQLRVTGVDRAAADRLFSEGQTVEPPVPLDRVQGLIVRGYGHMPEARYLMLRVRGLHTDAMRRWIGELPLTSAEAGSRSMLPSEPLINVAFSYDGLRALGVNEELCQRFSTAFVRGAHDDYRARVNGDVGDNAPEKWEWGSSRHPVHLVLLIFAKTKTSADEYAARYAGEARDHGLELVKTLEGTTLPDRKEHFGFRDGIGQPRVQGFGGTDQEDDAVAAGEFLLGRRDGYGNRADAPDSPNGFCFGHNGSYLVFRQLEQDVGAFWRHCASVGGSAQDALRVAAKLIGRWPSGASLVRHPDKDPGERRFEDEDDFTYLANDEDNDRYGARCPFGAHIRRANPRDWNLGETREESLKIANLHRIVRRGRPYGAPLDEMLLASSLVDKASAESAEAPAPRGLQFLCFNANIERQFEFIQQHWCNNPHFAGSDDGPDPVLGTKPRFVRVVGGTYFFMPSISAVKLLGDGLVSRDAAPALESPPPDEQASVDNLINRLRQMTTRDYKGRMMSRGAHPKMHGCVEAKFRIEADLQPDLKVGLFAKPAAYPTWIRFSNESAPAGGADIERGIRGLALKLMNVPGAKLLDGEEYCTTHDFVLITTDQFVTKNAAEFDALIKAVAVGPGLNKLTVLSFMLRHPRSLWNLARASKRFSNVLDITYFSPTPYLLGTRAVKYMLRPTELAPSDIPSARNAEQDYLADRLHQRLASGAVSFDFLVQVQSDPKTMPVEDPRIAWNQSLSPFLKVATLEIPRQVVNTPERRVFGENLSFNPWRCLPEHRPLGGVNRARRQVYRALTRFRHSRNDVALKEPSSPS
ncbi:MAG TPA: Dyp-type peroxidase [Polyangiales bacterium]|nr:Dyp-type peroxidase [Polyangiales bacterium]